MGVVVASNHGYNMGLEITKCSMMYLDHREVELNKLIDELKVTNIQVKIMQDVMNKLAHAKQKDKKIDLSNDEITKKYAYLAYLANPSIFEGKVHNAPTEEVSLKQKLNEVIDQLREEGHVGDIHLGLILEKIECDPNIQFEVLDESAIDVVLQGLDAELKSIGADLNKLLMDINSKYEDRSLLIEQVRQMLKDTIEEIKSFIQKTGRGG